MTEEELKKAFLDVLHKMPPIWMCERCGGHWTSAGSEPVYSTCVTYDAENNRLVAVHTCWPCAHKPKGQGVFSWYEHGGRWIAHIPRKPSGPTTVIVWTKWWERWNFLIRKEPAQ
jgi:hypothetical protein